jgi:hypothetical protein
MRTFLDLQKTLQWAGGFWTRLHDENPISIHEKIGFKNLLTCIIINGSMQGKMLSGGIFGASHW